MTTPAPAPRAGAAHSQTLARGIRLLELLAEASTPRTIAELAADLGVHRSIAYRILRTLEDHRLVMRDESGRVQSAPGLAVLARGVQRDLQSAALPELTVLANDLQMSAFIAVWDHHDCTTLLTVEPRHGHGAVLQRPGTRHPFDQGAPGIAIQSSQTEAQWARISPGQPYREEATRARVIGYATSIDEVISGVSSVAVPLQVPGQLPAAISVVYATALNPMETAAIGQRLRAAAVAIENVLGS
ncbi:IclR family transcriptional regulator [Paeniglutamicibacter cryotolerans]|uniref:DNA-binding IclR family transcriptional regulator n=1 Tax=Paeniglutamicibacter cryotolerans TaxID=670079 RepID=A0A839QKP7_9MICC|nr:helix-turn-helix domain-containing protein [Paeniglutamicibacter cryotolerans]MBB2996427.1 DNA-binding IclR family transcriptional regulator [Paeniglutamicibacter cryotolerans]